MSQYLLDTNICIHYLKGQYELHQKITQVGFSACYLSEITIAELLFGVENSAEDKREKNRESVYNLRNAFSDHVLRINDAFDEYARQKAALKRSGRLIGEFDLLIGTTAIVHGLILITRNTRHFAHLEGIELQNWIDL